MPVAKTVVNAKTGKRRNHKVAKKVKKTRSFLSKRAGFVVDDTGLEKDLLLFVMYRNPL